MISNLIVVAIHSPCKVFKVIQNQLLCQIPCSLGTNKWLWNTLAMLQKICITNQIQYDCSLFKTNGNRFWWKTDHLAKMPLKKRRTVNSEWNTTQPQVQCNKKEKALSDHSTSGQFNCHTSRLTTLSST